MRMRKKKHCSERLEQCSQLWIKEPEQYKGKWSEIFGNDNPIHIEIGCGKGQFICGMAQNNPDINYIAIDVVPDVLVLALEKATRSELENVRLIIADAGKLCDYFEYDEIKQIYLNFSDPWKKSRQAKRRLTHKNFLDIYKKLLKNGNLICFKTDNKALFEFSLNSFAQENFKMQNITLDLHNSKFEGNVMTEYEERFSSQGFPIYRLEAKYIGWN
ncbi:MAG: tRNA (guanosine(46)-N7)-methyltransferase TrmB [Clostridia bacterium]|nr:tRNA (guanosine(46)-N7)-methyltransferase TrmB [Clostridia bacterium]